MHPMDQLLDIASFSGHRNVDGLPRQVVEKFLRDDPSLQAAVAAAHRVHLEMRIRHPEFLGLAEADQRRSLTHGFLDFYDEWATNPYVPLAARGPWIVTTAGAVIHDSGGYGMLGFGHAPDDVIAELANGHVMANVMTPNVEQQRFVSSMHAEIGHTRPTVQPVYRTFACLGSGSEVLTLAMRITDTRAKTEIERRGIGPRAVKVLSFNGSFHGRTYRPARASASSRATYTKSLASFAQSDDLIIVEPDDVAGIAAAFESTCRQREFIEAVLMEPVMGEGAPGRAISPNCYSVARTLTEKYGGMLIVDSVQAGLRAHGCLSIVDYPGFENLPPPDMEAFAKAVNAGQYPVSVLALSETATTAYASGTYGNTMTANPRGLAVVSAVLRNMTPELRQNIRDRGRELLAGLMELQRRYPALVNGVTGTGLLVAAELNAELATVSGAKGVGRLLRRNGIGFISGGKNGLRFTPHFRITTREVQIIVDALDGVLSYVSDHPTTWQEAL